jgi:hypothetical protein
MRDRPLPGYRFTTTAKSATAGLQGAQGRRHAPGGPGCTHMKEPIRLLHSGARVG